VANRERASGRRFDRDHHATTQAILFLSQLDDNRASEAYAHATHYEPVPIPAFRALLSHLTQDVIRTSTFVDVGSGMGRAVLLASEYAFKQIVGIELSPALHAVACTNLAEATGLKCGCRDVRLRRGDARRFRYPKGDLVVFLFNPFDECAMRATLERILSSRAPDDRVILAFHTPVHHEAVAEYAAETIADGPEGVVVRLEVPIAPRYARPSMPRSFCE
jgi:SAM-dependent methyltransferase